MSREDWLRACEDAYSKVYRSLIAMGAAPADAADALQDAWERVLKQQTPVARPDGWLFVVALRRGSITELSRGARRCGAVVGAAGPDHLVGVLDVGELLAGCAIRWAEATPLP